MPEATVYDLARDFCFVLSSATNLKIAGIDRNEVRGCVLLQ